MLGICLQGSEVGDQCCIMMLEQVLLVGVDYMVIGCLVM